MLLPPQSPKMRALWGAPSQGGWSFAVPARVQPFDSPCPTIPKQEGRDFLNRHAASFRPAFIIYHGLYTLGRYCNILYGSTRFLDANTESVKLVIQSYEFVRYRNTCWYTVEKGRTLNIVSASRVSGSRVPNLETLMASLLTLLCQK